MHNYTVIYRDASSRDTFPLAWTTCGNNKESVLRAFYLNKPPVLCTVYAVVRLPVHPPTQYRHPVVP